VEADRVSCVDSTDPDLSDHHGRRLFMPGKKMRGIKNPALYEKLRGRGVPKERAARISNSQAAKSKKKRTAKKRRR
jgi:hypothetical protein